MLKKVSVYSAIFLSGASLTLAFAPFDIWPLAIICPALLLVVWKNASPKQAFYQGALFGFGFFSTGVSWVYISLHDYGQANPWLAGVLTLLMIGVLLSYVAIGGYLLNRYFPHQHVSRYVIAFPSLWVLGEWCRGWVLTGFPWLFVGYSQLATPLSGLAPLVSVFGVSWAAVATAGLLGFLWVNRRTYNLNPPYIAMLFIGLLWLSGFAFNYVNWTQPMGKPIQVSLVQGNIPQTLKWAPDQAEKNLLIYNQLTAPYWDSQLIIWPEAAITFFQSQIPDYLEGLTATAKSHHSTLLTGIPLSEDGNSYNGMIALGNQLGSYKKRHLVPFGEFMPLRFLLVWLENYVQIPMSDFSRGSRFQPLMQVNHIPIAAFICYEIAYPSEVLDALPEGKILVTISDDSWFGKSIAPLQHLQIAQMRALETGRYLVMSTNDGMTAIIDATGKIQAIAPRYETIVLTGEAQPRSGATPWVKIGIYPLIISFGLLLYLARRKQQKLL